MSEGLTTHYTYYTADHSISPRSHTYMTTLLTGAYDFWIVPNFK